MIGISAGFSIGTIVCAALGLVALVVLFFPFVFKVDFDVDLMGAKAEIRLFRKLLYTWKKSFKKDSDEDELDSLDGGHGGDSGDGEDVVPTYVPPKKKPMTEESTNKEPVKDAVEDSVTAQVSAPSTSKERLESNTPKIVEPKTDSAKVSENLDEPKTDEEKEKPKLSETEFWTIILTPEMDSRAFWAVKKLLTALLKLFRIKFEDCFVEGIRTDYVSMGYGAALNGILKSFPYIDAWDFRMDWTHDHEQRAQGRVRISVNLCRIIGLLLTVLFYGGIVAFKFWRRRAQVLKTHELPELGWVRKKIVKLMAEEE